MQIDPSLSLTLALLIQDQIFRLYPWVMIILGQNHPCGHMAMALNLVLNPDANEPTISMPNSLLIFSQMQPVYPSP